MKSKSKLFRERRGHVVFVVLYIEAELYEPRRAYASKWAASRYVNAEKRKDPQACFGIVELPLAKAVVVGARISSSWFNGVKVGDEYFDAR